MKIKNKVAWHIWSKLTAVERKALFLRAEDDLEPYLAKVAPIVKAVKDEGDAALSRYSLMFEGIDLLASHGSFLASEPEFLAAEQAISADLKETLTFAAEAIRKFHARQMPESQWMMEMRPGVMAGERVTALDRVACYVPRGKGSFPSVALMTAIPAIVAGVKDVSIFTPPDRHGHADAATLVAAKLAGVHRVYKLGGAQAIAAAAYGTESIKKVPRLVGPGSPFVAAAKRLVAGVMDGGMPAGPSEVIILAAQGASADLAALDLLIEAEHGSDSGAFLVTWDKELAQAIADRIPHYWQNLAQERQNVLQSVLGGQHGGIVLFDDEATAFDFINEYAPEHLQILASDPLSWVDKIRNAGEILLGDYTPGSIANYLLGPNCVLPTAAGARCFSPLSVHDFLKRSSIAQLSRQGYDVLAPHTQRYARYEGFEAHAQAVSDIRLPLMDEAATSPPIKLKKG